MQSKIMYLPSGAEYNNRKEAKLKMGHSRFNKALKDGLMLFIKDSDRQPIKFSYADYGSKIQFQI